MERLKEYFIVGGLPEVVRTYCANKENKADAYSKVREKQEELIQAYMSDFSKYSGKVRANEIAAVFESIPAQLARESKKFKASDAIPKSRFSRLKSPIDWLKAGLSGKLKSLNIFVDKYPVKYRTRISARNLEFNEQAKIHNYPLYLSFCFPFS